MSPTDAMLFENWRHERNADAFKTLATRYAPMVYETSRRILKNPSEAEDVTQECFIILAGARKPIGGYLAPWLHRVAYNRSIAHLRSERRRRAREVQFAAEQDTSCGMAWNEIGGYIDEAIAGLPEKLRGPIVACFLDGKTHEAAAQMLGIPRSTLTYRVDKGIQALRKSLKSKGVAVSAAALAGTMKAGAATAAPVSVLANLGKLALSGADHIALPAAGAPLVQTALGLWTAKAAMVAAAGLGIVLFSAWGVHNNAAGPPEPPEVGHVNLSAVASIPNEAAEAKESLLAERPSSTDTEADLADLALPGDRRTGMEASGRFYTAQAGSGLWDTVSGGVSDVWKDLRRSLSGENTRRGECQNNLKLFGLVFKLSANESPEHGWPMLNPAAGCLIFANDDPGTKPLFPAYFLSAQKFVRGRSEYAPRNLEADPSARCAHHTSAGFLVCPSDPQNMARLRQPGPAPIDDDYSYYYLGYAVRDIDDLEAFAAAYRERIAQGLPFDTDLDTPRGKLHRLREGVERGFITDVSDPAATAKIQARLPVLIEPPSHHDPEGGNVLFMDGHVEFMRYAPNGQFPMNADAMDILRSLSAMKRPAP